MVNKEVPLLGNGHMLGRLMRKLLQQAFAPPRDPHESYLIKDDEPEKVGRTKEFGYVCYCWRDKPEVCQSCYKQRYWEIEIRNRPWKPSTRAKAIGHRAGLMFGFAAFRGRNLRSRERKHFIMLVKKAGAKYKSRTARASATITNGDLGAWRRGLLNMEQQRINYVQVDYSVCDHDFLCRLKLFLFEDVYTEPLDHGHKLFHCSGPKDEQVK